MCIQSVCGQEKNRAERRNALVNEGKLRKVIEQVNISLHKKSLFRNQ